MSPSFVFATPAIIMLEAKEIEQMMTAAVEGRACFLVDMQVSRENDVEITIESCEGIVDLEDCAAVSHAFESSFDREKEDYSITVSSAGLDQPFKVLRQYVKAVGTKVEVSLKGGRKFVASLDAADEEGISLSWSAREAVEGKKKKELVAHSAKFPYGKVNAVVPYIEF